MNICKTRVLSGLILALAVAGCDGPGRWAGEASEAPVVEYTNGDRYVGGVNPDRDPYGFGTYYAHDGTTTTATHWRHYNDEGKSINFPGGKATVHSPDGTIDYLNEDSRPWGRFQYDQNHALLFLHPILHYKVLGHPKNVVTDPGNVAYVAYDILLVGNEDENYLGIPGPLTLSKTVSRCGVNAEWISHETNKATRLVLLAACKAGVPDGLASFFSEDSLMWIEGTYEKGQLIGKIQMTEWRLEDFAHLAEGGASLRELRLARGTPRVTTAGGKTKIEFASLDTYLIQQYNQTTRFVGGETASLLPNGKGRCSEDTWHFPSNAKATRTTIAFEPCEYKNYGLASYRVDPIYTARINTMRAEMAAEEQSEKRRQDELRQEQDEAMAQQAQRDAEEADDESSSAPYVPSAIAGMERLQEIQRDSERYGAVLRATRPDPQRQAPFPRAPSSAPSAMAAVDNETGNRNVVAPPQELPMPILQPTPEISPFRQTCPPGSSPMRQTNGLYVTTPAAAICVKDPAGASGQGTSGQGSVANGGSGGSGGGASGYPAPIGSNGSSANDGTGSSGRDAKQCIRVVMVPAKDGFDATKSITNTCNEKISIAYCHLPSSLGGTKDTVCGYENRHFQQFGTLDPGESSENHYTMPVDASLQYGACFGDMKQTTNGEYTCQTVAD